jgi:adenylate cyclase
MVAPIPHPADYPLHHAGGLRIADFPARRLAVILSADVVGFSAMMERDEERTYAQIDALRREVIEPALTNHHGRLVKTTGDGFLAEFASPVQAVRSALAIQEQLGAFGDPKLEALRLRIGINLGDILVAVDGDIYGDGVNVATRLEQIAEPGDVCLSGAVYDQVERIIDRTFENRGEQQVKNIDRPVRVYALGRTSTKRAVRSEPPPLPDKPSIAVLPFQNMGGDPEQEYFADGMVEDIISGLSYLPWLMVIARNSTFTYKGKAVDVKQVGRELGVRYVLEGRVRKAGARVRITGQLIDATTGGHIWAGRFDGALEDVFDLQDRVTANVVGAIEPRLQRAEIERTRRKPTESLDAYDYFLRGMASFFFTRDSLIEARRFFQRATELDPNYGSAYGMAAWCVHLSKTNGWMLDPEREIAEGVRMARRAAAVGNDDPTALWSSGHSLAYLAGEVETGVAHIDRAIVLNPNLASAWSSSGWLSTYLGEPEDAIERLERSMRLSPLDPFAYFGHAGMALAHILAYRYDNAVSWAAKAMNEQPEWATSFRLAAIAYALWDRMVEAREAMARLRAIDPTLRLSNLKRVAPPLRRPEDRDRFIEGLRLAGLPE